MSAISKNIIWILSSLFIVLSIEISFHILNYQYKLFNADAEVTVSIPGIKEGFTQQGLTYLEDEDLFVFSGYMLDSSKPSRLYVVSKKSNNDVKYVTLQVNNRDFYGHCGGVATDGVNMWVASGNRVYRLNVADLLKAENGQSIEVIDYFNPQNEASFCCVSNGMLWVGEFYREGNYETDESHWFLANDGYHNKAIVSAFEINSERPFGIESTTPNKILSIRNSVQGMTVTKSGRIVLSTSYGAKANSYFYIYKNVFTDNSDSTLKVNNVDVPVWYLDDAELQRSFRGSCMAEGIVYVNGEVYVSFESACQKYYKRASENVEYLKSFKLD